jgi:signal transduction histidine kinase
VFRGLVKRPAVPVEQGAAIPYEASLCSRIHRGESPATVPETRDVPALWRQWLQLKEGLGVDWDIRAFCTRRILLPDGTLFGTLCVHHLAPRAFSRDEEALLEVLARMLGEEIWRERAATELTAALRAVEDAERGRVELAEELRHELRAPLQIIDAYAEAMLDGVAARDDDHLGLVRLEVRRATRLLADILELVRIEASPAAGADAAPADEVVAEMRDRFAPLAEAAGVELVADAVPARVPLPRKRLEQYLVNLLRNSLRSIEEGGGSRITLFVRPEQTSIAVGVEDDGPGVEPEQLPRVFDRFYRGGGESRPGSGLGLTIARRIVERAGGEVEANLLAPRGLRVIARLPPGRPPAPRA